jgi:hypothetical protein
MPDTHPLLKGARELFETARPNGVFLAPLFLHPFTRKLPDITVAKDTLPWALEAANALYLHFETRGYPVTLAARGIFCRCESDSGGHGRERFRDEWAPCSPTVVRVRTVAFGLRLFETTKEVETVWLDGKSVPIDLLPLHRRRAYGARRTNTVPSGSLALAAYSPYPDTSWHKEWRETSAGSLSRMLSTIQRELEAAAPDVARLAAEADERAEAEKRRQEEEQRRWEEQQRERARQEQERRQRQAAKDSRDQLLAIVDAWVLANRVEDFFRDASCRLANEVEQDSRERLVSRLEAARQMLGATNALEHFRSWKTPEEHLATSLQGVAVP